MKQTAVKWLRDLYENRPAYEEFILEEEWEEALKMEKEQLMDAYIEASPNLEDIIKEASEGYYNETFNTKEDLDDIKYVHKNLIKGLKVPLIERNIEEPSMTFATSEQIAQHIEDLKTLDMTGYEVEKQGWIQQWEEALKVQKQWELNQNKDE
jgi:hypothetical protein